MGTLDFLKEFEGRAIDAASYKLLQRNFELQESNTSLLKDKVDILEKRLVETEAELTTMRKENMKLRNQIDSTSREDGFKVFEGIAFRRAFDGQFDSQPYCPCCHTPMSNTMRKVYNCPSCSYMKKSRLIAECLAEQLNNPEGKQGVPDEATTPEGL